MSYSYNQVHRMLDNEERFIAYELMVSAIIDHNIEASEENHAKRKGTVRTFCNLFPGLLNAERTGYLTIAVQHAQQEIDFANDPINNHPTAKTLEEVEEQPTPNISQANAKLVRDALTNCNLILINSGLKVKQYFSIVQRVSDIRMKHHFSHIQSIQRS